MSRTRGTISTYASGVDLVVEWKIENFFNFPESDGAFYFSPDFSFGGEGWHLAIIPYGWTGTNSSGHMDLGFYKVSSCRSIKQSFSLSLKTVKREKYNEEHCVKDFDNSRYYIIFNRFIPRLELTERRSELFPEDILTVVCTMKNTTSAGSASDAASAKCCHCKGTFDAHSLYSHQKKCLHRPIRCPDCLDVVVLQKWFDEHECQQERPEAGKEHKENSENTGVNASTQTE